MQQQLALVRLLLVATLLFGPTACGINGGLSAPDGGSAPADDEKPDDKPAQGGVSPATDAGPSQPNVALDNNAAEPNAPAPAAREPGLALGPMGTRKVSVDANAVANGLPLRVIEEVGPSTGTFSYYGGKMYAANGCISRQHKNGGYLMLRACDDANASLWSTYYGSTFTWSANNPNYDQWRTGPCPGGPSGEANCYVSPIQAMAGQIGLNVMHTQVAGSKQFQGVLLHFAAQPNRCLTDDGTPMPKVVACDLANPGQSWTLSLFTPITSSRVVFLQSGRGRCFELPTGLSLPKLVACDVVSGQKSHWFVERDGHLGTVTTQGDRLYLVLDPNTNALAYINWTSFKPSMPAVWGFGPYPSQLRAGAP